jgi:hypothetical protein
MSDDGNDKRNLEAAGCFLKYQFEGKDFIRQVTVQQETTQEKNYRFFKDKVLQFPVLKLNSLNALLSYSNEIKPNETYFC